MHLLTCEMGVKSETIWLSSGYNGALLYKILWAMCQMVVSATDIVKTSTWPNKSFYLKQNAFWSQFYVS